jgi:tetratricopeptide (TPR) repeat protein
MKRILIPIFIVISLFSFDSNAQSVRSLINKGVEEYNKNKNDDAEVSFKKALDKDIKSFEAHYNLGNTYFKKGNYDEALKEYQSALSLTKDKKQKSDIFYNIGNTLLKQKKLEDAIKAYVNSLHINPKDNDTKYNLSYALKQKKENKNKQSKKNKDNKNDKNKKNKEKNKNDKDKQNKNKNKQKNNRDKQKQQQNKNQNKQKKQQQQKQKLSKKEAERILAALKKHEKSLQKKLRKKKGKPIKTEKDW